MLLREEKATLAPPRAYQLFKNSRLIEGFHHNRSASSLSSASSMRRDVSRFAGTGAGA